MEVSKKGATIMKSLFRHILCFFRAEHGLAVTEYGIMLAMIVLISIFAIGELGRGAGNTFTNVGTHLEEAKVSTQTPID
jgi:Flp pilus assembly pilin Flp